MSTNWSICGLLAKGKIGSGWHLIQDIDGHHSWWQCILPDSVTLHIFPCDYHWSCMNSTSVIWQLCPCFMKDVIADNDTAFCSRTFGAFTEERSICLCFQAVYASARNGIVEWCQECEKGCYQELVHWYNVIAQNDILNLTALANKIYSYEVQLKGIDAAPLSLRTHLTLWDLQEYFKQFINNNFWKHASCDFHIAEIDINTFATN